MIVVGSFVWTHLTNMQETSSPLRQSIREILKDDYLDVEFKTDMRKFSRAYEGTTLAESHVT